MARVRAYNERGWGSWSVDNTAGALIETEPSQMSRPRRGSATGTDRLELEWTLLVSPDDGYSAVTTYALDWDAGTAGGTWTSLVGEDSDYTLSSYLVTEDVDVGVSYLFKVRAYNVWGWGEYSPEATVAAATTPGQVATATTSIEATAGSMVIVWTVPDNRGGAITSYQVEIRDYLAASWTAETTYCGGSTVLTCTVPMSVVTSAPYSLS